MTEKRITIAVSEMGKNKLTEAAKQLGLNQWDMADVLFRLADPNRSDVRLLASQIKKRNDTFKEKRKQIKNRLKLLSDAELDKLIDSK